MAVTVVAGFLVCSMGLQRGVERITKIMMGCLLVVMLFLVIRSVTAGGRKRHPVLFEARLRQDVPARHLGAHLCRHGAGVLHLSLGIGAMTIFGSYIDKQLPTGESIHILLLDTFVAHGGPHHLPACFAFDVDAGSGPGLVFVTLLQRVQ